MKKLLSITLLVVFFHSAAWADEIIVTQPLNLGTVSPNFSASGTITIPANGPVASSNLQIISIGAPANLSFNSTLLIGLLVTLSFANQPAVLTCPGSPDITISNFTVNPPSLLLSLGTFYLKAGAKVTIPVNARGLYTGMVTLQAYNLLVLYATVNIPIQIRVLKALSISSNADLNFGTINMLPSGSGTVRLDPLTGTRSLLSGGGISLPPSYSSVGQFMVSGEANTPVSLTIPSTVTLSNAGGAVISMTPRYSTSTGTGTLDITGALAINIGGDIVLSAGQSIGVYNGSYGVAVIY